MIRLGTSGFSYDDWVGVVYPENLPRWQWLAYYAAEFDTVELNVTYYRIPDEKIIRGWIERTPDGFQFSLKAHQSLTHGRDNPDYQAFNRAIEPLVNAGKLACVLAQFPHSFHPTEENRSYLLGLREGIRDLPVVIELRDDQWLQTDVFDFLEEMGLGYCCVDEPQIKGLMPPVVRSTSQISYVRFHGRNAAKWWQHEQAWERYDYSYSEDELREWIPRLQELEQNSPLTLVYANNHYKGQSVDTLRKLKSLLTGT